MAKWKGAGKFKTNCIGCGKVITKTNNFQKRCSSCAEAAKKEQAKEQRRNNPKSIEVSRRKWSKNNPELAAFTKQKWTLANPGRMAAKGAR